MTAFPHRGIMAKGADAPFCCKKEGLTMIDFFLRRWVSDHQNTQDPAVRQRYGTLSGVVGIVLNLLLFAGKFLAAALTGVTYNEEALGRYTPEKLKFA